MASLAEVRVEEAEPMENESQARPEELRLLLDECSRAFSELAAG